MALQTRQPKPPAGLEWFVPVFYLKLLVSHLLKELPFPLDA